MGHAIQHKPCEWRIIDEETVSLYMVNPKAPCFIKDDEGKFIYLILPVNFNAGSN